MHFVTPDSRGAPEPDVTRVKEFNPCHDPKTGQFGSKGEGGCESGSWEDPWRNRSIYGQEVPAGDEDAALDYSNSRQQIDPLDDVIDADGDAHEAKDTIAKALGSKVDTFEGRDVFAADLSSSINAAMSEIEGDNSDGDDPHPEPSGEKDSYQEYVEGQQEEADNAQNDYAREEYIKAKEKALEEAVQLYAEAEEMWLAARAGHPYGDLTKHPVLQDNVVLDQQYTKYGDDMVDFQPKARTLEPHEVVELMRKMHTSKTSEAEAEATTAQLEGLTSFTRLGDTKTQHGLEKISEKDVLLKGHEYFDPDDDDEYAGFDRYREREVGEPDYDNERSGKPYRCLMFTTS